MAAASRIIGTGSALPSRAVTNAQLVDELGRRGIGDLQLKTCLCSGLHAGLHTLHHLFHARTDLHQVQEP